MVKVVVVFVQMGLAVVLRLDGSAAAQFDLGSWQGAYFCYNPYL